MREVAVAGIGSVDFCAPNDVFFGIMSHALDVPQL
jgi:hypothetical protein